jgi:hypothetical protein
LEFVFCKGVQHRLNCVKVAAFQSWKQKWRKRPSQASRLCGGQQSCCCWSTILLWKRKCETVCCLDATAISFVSKVRGEVFAHFYAVVVSQHRNSSSNSSWDWLFRLAGRILCEQSPWCTRKCWACSWLYSSPVLPFFGLPWTKHATQTAV